LANKVNVGKPEIYSIPFFSDIIDSSRSNYWKNAFGEVTLVAMFSREAGFSYGLMVAQLPEGFRPPMQIELPVYFYRSTTSTSSVGSLYIETNGLIKTAYNSDLHTYCAIGSVSFVAAS